MNKAQFETFDPQAKRALTVDEYSFRYGVGRTSAYELIRKGQLASIKIGGRRLVPVEAAEKLLTEIINEQSK